VSTLIKWFPDRPGMATGMAIMGFGGGAFIASPLSVWLMGKFSTPTHVGVAETFLVLGAVYFCFMMVGAAIVRVPPPGWQPEAYVPPAQPKKLITTQNVYVYQALRTPQFWLIWWVLCLNVTAGIGVLGQASAMSQEMFQGRITAVAASGLVGLFSLFNMGGRFAWSSISDYLGRKNTYFVFFALGTALYALVPYTGSIGSVTLFVLFYAIIFSMYGGGFATVRLSARYLRHALCRRHPRPAADGLVGGRHLRTDARQLYPRIQRQPRRGQGAGLQRHHVCNGSAAGHRFRLQLLGDRRPRAASHEPRTEQGRSLSTKGQKTMKGDEDGDNRLKLILALGIRRHPARLGRDRNLRERTQAVSMSVARKHSATPP
jgi:MFS family permease